MITDITQENKRSGESISEDSPKKKKKMFAPNSRPNSKTPIMLLQETCAKMNHHLPCYSEITDAVPDEYADQNMRFFIGCSALGLYSIGGGVTKKMAKHTAAEKLLIQLRQDSGDTADVQSYSHSLEVNAITELHDYCTVKNFHRPDFKCVSIFGPTHDPSFTFECSLDSIVGKATAGTKQLAKQLSAKVVLDIVKQDFPDSEKKLVPLNQKTPADIAREKITSYRELKKRDMVDSMGTTIKDRHNFFRKQDPDFVTALRDILDSEEIDEDKRYEALITELERMWQCEKRQFLETDLEQFEVMIDCEVFTCSIIAKKDQMRDEVIKYFGEMLDPIVTNHEKSPTFDQLSSETKLEEL